jgi:hypothetical protein
MKSACYKKVIPPLVILSFIGRLSACASGPEEFVEPNFGDTREPESEEALVLVNWEGDSWEKGIFSSRMYILLDEAERLILVPGSQGRIVVPKGKHVIQAIYNNGTGKRGVKGHPYYFSVNARQITFNLDGVFLSIGQ